MTNKPKNIGTACETAVVRYLRANGFPTAERSALHGRDDEGDITGTPGICWEVKGGKTAETASDTLVDAWLGDTDIERRNRKADIGVLVMKRRGKGVASAGLWWVVMSGRDFARAADLTVADGATFPQVRMTLAHCAAFLRRFGYGDPI